MDKGNSARKQVEAPHPRGAGAIAMRACKNGKAGRRRPAAVNDLVRVETLASSYS